MGDRPQSFWRCLTLGIVFSVIAIAAGEVRADDEHAPVDLRHDILPLLRARCTKCHGPISHEGELDLSSPRSLSRGGDQGPPVVPGKLDESLLWQRVEADEMPPDSPLEDEEKDLLKAWIANGAHGMPTPEEARQPGPDHWAFTPPVRPEIPKVKHEDQVRNDVDRFLLEQLEAHGMSYLSEADKATLIRRVSFDLIGLPPTLEEMAVFLADTSPDAYENMVERYLASPRYGERWGQHWLDAAGYADSNGYFNADSDRPLAYRYRDYVIQSFNADKPFNRFIEEQLAGDELAGYQRDGDVTPQMEELLIATHFLRNAQDGTGESDGNDDEQLVDRFSVLEGTLQIVSSSMLGVTLQCARCHDHKFEPVTQKEYYQLQAVFWPAYNPSEWKKPKERTTIVATRQEREAHQKKTKEIDRQIAAIRAELETQAEPLRKELLLERTAKLEATTRQSLLAAAELPDKKRTAAQKKLVKTHKALIEIGDADLDQRSAEFAKARQEATERIAAIEQERPAPLREVAILWDMKAKPEPHHVLVRGDYRTHGDEVGPGVPHAFSAEDCDYEEPKGSEYSSGRRLSLARWMTNPRHPLLTRVTVNRMWQHHFGTGIVASADNFGYTGSPPTHPELLDYLAVEFVERGWSVKAMHRLILNSAAYRQSSHASDKIRKADPDNLLLSRFPLLRLDAEAIRDSMLRASGELDARMGGPYVPTERAQDGEVLVASSQDGANRRSVYLQRRRTQLNSMLDVFDAPIVVTNCTRRTASTVPLQSLSLLNSKFVTDRALAMVKRLEQSAGDDAPTKIAQAFLLTYGRVPTAEEMKSTEAFLASQPKAYPGDAEAQQRAWRDLCQMLLASNAFLYIE